MAKRRAMRIVRQANPSPGSNVIAEVPAQVEAKEDRCSLIEPEGLSEIWRLNNYLLGCICSSYLKEEQLQTTALQFFNENLPNLTVLRNEDNGQFELKWDNKDDHVSKEHANRGDLHVSLLHHMSVAYPDYSAPTPSFAGYEFSSKTVKTSLRDVDSLQIRHFVLEEPFGTHILGVQDSLQTPGASSERMSIAGKNGEMLLSVDGSPLGVYKEGDMEAIHESEED